jgi:alpha-beta hydrolase superfamily lysophospholipase
MDYLKPIKAFSVFVFLITSIPAVWSQKELPSRGFAGFGYRAITRADVDSMNLFDTNGVCINLVLPDSPAERAGFRAGDILKKYDDHVIPDNLQFVDIYQKYYAGDKITVTFLRNDSLKKTELTLEQFPRETSSEIDIEYTSFPAGDAYLRAVVTSPPDSRDEKLPALLIVSALGSYRLIASPYYSLQKELAYDVSKAGFRVLRFEQRGFGDSEGEDFRTMDFNSEVDDNLAALDYLLSRNDVDKDNVFVFGHSTGGIVAALIAAERQIAGIITSCTIGRTYYERTVETLRLQGELAGDSKIEIAGTIKKYMNLMVPVAQGRSLQEILRESPGISGLVNTNGRIMDDRTAEYWHQKLNMNIPRIYSKITEPVMIIYGESDFLTQLACHKNIEDVLLSANNPNVTFKAIPNLDHAYAYARDKKESFMNYKTRNFKKNQEVFDEIITWIDMISKKTD